jgi:hypothetical protein
MSEISTRITVASLAVALVLAPAILFAQGPLTPPGAPAPSFKSLIQIEPRVDVLTLNGDATALYVINLPGSYYLTKSLTGESGKAVIAIASNDVHLDLNGFALTGIAGSTRGVEIRSTQNVTVRNGSIRGSGAEGIATVGGSAAQMQLEDLALSSTGGMGISLNNSNTNAVRRCTVRTTSGTGIELLGAGTVAESSVESCTSSGAPTVYGINAGEITNSTAGTILNNGSGPAVGIAGSVVTHSRALNVAGAGITSGINAATVDACSVAGISGLSGANAVQGIAGTTVTNSTASAVNVSSGNIGVTGINGSQVSGCTASGIGTGAGTGSITGINATSVNASSAITVGSTSSSVSVGISSAKASDCIVQFVGAANGKDAAGINGSGTVTGCRVNGISGTGSLFGILGDLVAHSSVESVTQNPGTSGAATGISAERVVDSQVTTVTGSAPPQTVGISASRSASGCSVSTVSNATGSSAGIVALVQGAQVQRCSVLGGGLPNFTGISISGGLAVGNSLDGASTAIALVNGSTADGNNITNCPTGITAFNNSLIIRNNFRQSPNAVSIDATSKAGSLVTATGAIASTNPWVNFRD